MRNNSLLDAVQRYLESARGNETDDVRAAEREMLLRLVKEERQRQPKETDADPFSKDALRTAPAFKRILVAVDTSEQAGFAVAVGARLAADLHSQLCLVHVVHMSPPTNPDLAYEQIALRPVCLEAGQYLLDTYAKRLGPAGTVEKFLREGDAVTEISDVATRLGADLIVIGTHGRGRFSAAIVGSVAQGVMRHVACPVLCVAHDPTAPLAKPESLAAPQKDYFPVATA